MRDGWKEVALGDVTAKIVKAAPNEDFDYVDISSVSRDSKSISSLVRMGADSAPGRARQHLRAGDVLVSTVRPNLNAVARVPEGLDGAVGSTGFSVLRASPEVNPGLLFAVARSSAFVDAMTERATGSSYPAVTDKIVREFRIALPPLHEQRRIVDLIAAVDDAIEAAEAEADGAKAAWAATCDAIAEDEDSADRRVSELVLTAKSGGTPSRANPAYYEGSIPWLKSGEVRGRAISTTSEMITEDALASSPAWLAPAGSVLVAMYGGGTVGQVGRLAEAMATNQAVLALVADPELVSPKLLYHLLSNDSPRLAEKAVGAAQANISKKVVLDHVLKVPSIGRQAIVVHALEAFLDAYDAARDTAESLRALRSNLLTVLLSGEHEIPASYDALLGEVA